jgi:hypothetical protein
MKSAGAYRRIKEYWLTFIHSPLPIIDHPTARSSLDKKHGPPLERRGQPHLSSVGHVGDEGGPRGPTP